MSEKYIIKTLVKLINAHENTERISIIEKELKNLGVDVDLIEISSQIKCDPFFTKREDEIGKQNIDAYVDNNSNETIILNTHFDTVPCEDEMRKASIRGNNVFGRGSCDALGQVVLLLLTLRELMKKRKEKFSNIRLQFVDCEETGGNGTLQLLYLEPMAKYAIVFEPTDLIVANACRGALWFTLEVYGKTTHMARIHYGENAIYKASYVINEMKLYWNRLIHEAKTMIEVKDLPFPIQVNLGSIQGGLINSTVPDIVVIEGSVGFLSNKTIDEVKDDLFKAVETAIEKYHLDFESKVDTDFVLRFNSLHNDPYNLKNNEMHVVERLLRATKDVIPNPMVGLFPASCDARLFYCRNHIPGVVFGPGKLLHAHSDNEQISVRDIVKASKILLNFLNLK